MERSLESENTSEVHQAALPRQISAEERAARWRLWRVEGVGFSRLMALITRLDGDLAALFHMSERAREEFVDEALFGRKTRERVLAALSGRSDRSARGPNYVGELEALPPKTRLLSIWEDEYPEPLRDLPQPPVFLYMRGDFATRSFPIRAALVGSRRASGADMEFARRMAGALGEMGVLVVSGGALGVDAAAHEGALEMGASTVALLPGGVDRPTPARNRHIFERMVEQGALISEYPLGVQARTYHFQRRNELIAALGQVIVVIRAGQKSGTMLTARAAARIGRPVCAVPGSPDDPLADGCNQLLVDGAWCVRNADDILARIFKIPAPSQQLSLSAAGSRIATSSPARARPPRPHPLERADFSADARELFGVLESLAKNQPEPAVERDLLTRQIEWPELRLSPALLELELHGAIIKMAGANAFRPAF